MQKINLTIIPRSSKNEIIQLSEDSYKIKLTAAPVDGEANKKLIEFLNKEWKVSKSKITIVKGLKSRNKVIKIED
ncbi:MAG: DUF167 domain-containing protein [Candidatus Magasanikbacteria bacterium]